MEHESGCNGPCIRQNAFDYWLWERCAAKSERELISNHAEETGGGKKGIIKSREKEQEYKKRTQCLKKMQMSVWGESRLNGWISQNQVNTTVFSQVHFSTMEIPWYVKHHVKPFDHICTMVPPCLFL